MKNIYKKIKVSSLIISIFIGIFLFLPNQKAFGVNDNIVISNKTAKQTEKNSLLISGKITSENQTSVNLLLKVYKGKTTITQEIPETITTQVDLKKDPSNTDPFINNFSIETSVLENGSYTWQLSNKDNPGNLEANYFGTILIKIAGEASSEGVLATLSLTNQSDNHLIFESEISVPNTDADNNGVIDFYDEENVEQINSPGETFFLQIKPKDPEISGTEKYYFCLDEKSPENQNKFQFLSTAAYEALRRNYSVAPGWQTGLWSLPLLKTITGEYSLCKGFEEKRGVLGLFEVFKAQTEYIAQLGYEKGAYIVELIGNQVEFKIGKVDGVNQESIPQQEKGAYEFLAPLPFFGKIIKLDSTSLVTYLKTLFRLIIGLLTVFAVLIITISGIQYMLEDTNIVKKGEAKSRIFNALWGLILALGSVVLLQTINPDILNISLSSITSTSISVGDGEIGTTDKIIEVINKTDNSKIKLTACDKSNIETISVFDKNVEVYKGISPILKRIDKKWRDDGKKYKIDSVVGYSCRDVAGQKGVYSLHAFGLALDINSDSKQHPLNQQIKDCTKDSAKCSDRSKYTDMPAEFVNLFTVATEGFGWGGNWTSQKDSMHFSKYNGPNGKEQGNNIVEL